MSSTKHAPHWLFDLDDTLHHAGAAVFPMINEYMTSYICRHVGVGRAEADTLRTEYWQRYGATLEGLQRHHGISPHHFLAQTHPMESLLPLIDTSTQLPQWLKRLNGRKWVFSNGPQHYVEAIVRHLGIEAQVEGCFGMDSFGLTPKPRVAAYTRVLRQAGLDAGRCIMVEDSAANLQTAKRLGMRTVWLSHQKRKPVWVDWRITSLLDLRRI
jgi:putative hydrolase of the HAD superfamily